MPDQRAASARRQRQVDRFGSVARLQPANGLANANNIAIPTPIRNAASIRPASRNILVCSVVHQLGLARRGLEVLAAHDADADTGTDGAQADDQAGGQGNESDDSSFPVLLRYER